MQQSSRCGAPSPELDAAIRRQTDLRESLLSPLATKSRSAVRRHGRKQEDIRTPYSRDADRIVHTRAYTRYIDKTQVFYLVENDHITHRVIHVQLVAKIARTIGRCLRLNEDLIEAIALGHDIGHIPYGHFGEECLSDLCERNGIGKFYHNVQSVRFLDLIEDCDLTVQVLDGILCHNGEADDLRITPEAQGGFSMFDTKVRDCARGIRSRRPMTLEGCVVKFADTIAYIGRDLQDAREISLIGDDIPVPCRCTEILGQTTGQIINTLILDLLEHSDGEEDGFISYSKEVETALIDLRTYSRQYIYNNPLLTTEKEKIRRMYATLFETCLDDLECGCRTAPIYTDFIDGGQVSPRYISSATPPELVRDFIAGMTDRYFGRRFEECVLPRKIVGMFNPNS